MLLEPVRSQIGLSRIQDESNAMATIATLDRSRQKGCQPQSSSIRCSPHAPSAISSDRPFYGADIITQADLIGVGSLPIVILTGFFHGRRARAAIGFDARAVRRSGASPDSSSAFP